MARNAAAAKTDIPMFLAKLWNLVDDPTTNSLIGWNTDGTSFIIQDPVNFAKHLLPQYFKHNNLASFIRVLNMYGFRKIVKLDSGSLRSVKEEMEFHHPCFIRGNEHLLICIKRKPSSSSASTTQVLQRSAADAVVSASASKGAEKEITKVLNDVRAIRDKQETMDERFNELKQNYENIWGELQELRSKHAHQQIVVNKLIEFFITLLHNSGNASGAQLRAPPTQLAIQTSLNEPPSAKRVRHDTVTPPSSTNAYRGPIIKDVTEAWTAAYPQQAPDIVDWDRLLSQNEANGQQQNALNGLRRAGTPASLPSTAQSVPSSPVNDAPAPSSPSTLPPELVDYLLNLLARPNMTATPGRTTFAGPSSVPQALQKQLMTVAPSGPVQPYHGISPGSQILAFLPPAETTASQHPQQMGIKTNLPTTSSSGVNYEANGHVAQPGVNMEEQVDTIQSNLDYIRDLLQNPNYNLDLSQIYQLFPDNNVPQMPSQQPTSLTNQTNMGTSSNNWPHNSENAIMEYHQQHDRQNMEDNALLSLEDNDDFMSVFNNLPGDDDLIEGVTIQIPESPSSSGSSMIPLPSVDSRNSFSSGSKETTVSSSANKSGSGKRKLRN